MPRWALYVVMGIPSLVAVAIVIAVMLQGRTSWTEVAVVGGFVAAAPWIALPLVCRGLAAITGWNRLAQACPWTGGDGQPGNGRLTSLAIGYPWLSCNNAFSWAQDDDHLHLWFALPGCGGIPRVSIPWDEVPSIEPASFGRCEIETGGVKLWLPQEMVEQERAFRSESGAV